MENIEICERRCRANNIIDLIKTRILLPEEVLLTVGSLAHGGFNLQSDIDIICISNTQDRVLQIANNLGLEISNYNLKKYKCYSIGAYLLINVRCNIDSIDLSCLVMDISLMEFIVQHPTEELFQLRNYIPQKDTLVFDYLKRRHVFQRKQIKINENIYISSYLNFVDFNGISGHGSLINKLTCKPIIQCTSVTSIIYEKFLIYLNSIYNFTKINYEHSIYTNKDCYFLNPYERLNKFSTETVTYLKTLVYQLNRDEL